MLLYKWRVSKLHRELGIANYDRLPLQQVATRLVYVQGIPMTMETALQWQRMEKAARHSGVTLFIFCAFRGVQEQAMLIRHFLKTKTMAEALEVAAAPGHSEHHTGRALDIGTTGCLPPTVEFEHTQAFSWLSTHAEEFNFTLTYPRNNRYGIAFEPWHWCQRTN